MQEFYPDPYEAADPASAPAIEAWMLWGLLGLAFLLLLAFLIFWLGTRAGRARMAREQEKSLENIYNAIALQLRAALATHGGSTINGARALIAEVDARLGAVLALNAGLSKVLGDLKKSLEPLKSEPAKPGQPPKPTAVVLPLGDGVGSAAAAAAGGAAAAAATAGGVGVGGGISLLAPAYVLPQLETGPHGAGPETFEDQVARARRALEQFAAYWEPRGRVLDALRQAQSQLNNSPSAPTLSIPTPVPAPETPKSSLFGERRTYDAGASEPAPKGETKPVMP